jgi:hypothetical protein
MSNRPAWYAANHCPKGKQLIAGGIATGESFTEVSQPEGLQVSPV